MITCELRPGETETGLSYATTGLKLTIGSSSAPLPVKVRHLRVNLKQKGRSNIAYSFKEVGDLRMEK